MATYGTLKTMKAAAIGTIMPWGGDLTAIPPGWLICNGQRIEALDYPLLTQMIGGNYGDDNLGGVFPNYQGGVFLPNINQRALVDVESSYFDGSRPPDTTEALAALQDPSGGSLIGPDSDNGVGTSFNAYTDIDFSYTPENDFTGKISGSNLSEVFGAKEVYVSPRKLGRKHMTSHGHTTTFDTIFGGGSTGEKPGAGVGTWGEINYRVSRANFDELDYGQVQAQLEIQYTSQQGFGGGQNGILVCNVQGEGPTYNLKPFLVNGGAIGNWFGNLIKGNPTGGYSMDETFLNGDTKLYASGGGTQVIPARNYDPGGGNSGDAVSYTKTLFDRDAISFNETVSPGGLDLVVQAHDHQPFQVYFDRGNLRVPISTGVNVISNVTPDDVDKALNVNVTTPTPSLICLYIIRAY